MQAMPNPKSPNTKKNFLIWLGILFVVVMLSNVFGDPANNANKISFSQFITKVDGNEVAKVDIKGKDLIGTTKTGEKFYTFLPDYPNLVEKLQEKMLK